MLRYAWMATALTSSPPSAVTGCRWRGKGGNSSCETAMPGRENVLGCVDVTVVYRSTCAARPFSCRISDPTSQTFQAFRASAPVTATTGLGGIGFVDFLEPHACDIAFVLQHGSECAPACVPNWILPGSFSQGP